MFYDCEKDAELLAGPDGMVLVSSDDQLVTMNPAGVSLGVAGFSTGSELLKALR